MNSQPHAWPPSCCGQAFPSTQPLLSASDDRDAHHYLRPWTSDSEFKCAHARQATHTYTVLLCVIFQREQGNKGTAHELHGIHQSLNRYESRDKGIQLCSIRATAIYPIP